MLKESDLNLFVVRYYELYHKHLSGQAVIAVDDNYKM